MRPQLLIVDDEARHVEALCRTLEPEGYDTVGFTSPDDALAALLGRAFDVLLTDLKMPGMDGIALLRTAVELDPDLVVLVMTGQGTIATAVDAMKAGALDYILKPLRVSAIRPVLSRALEVRRLRTENFRLREAIGIYELSTSIAATLDPDTILSTVVDAACQQSRAREAFVLTPTPDGGELRVAATRGTAARASLGEAPIPLGPQLLSWAMQSRERLSRLDEDAIGPGPLPGLDESSVAIPMFVGGRLAGVLVFRPTPSPRPIPLGQIKALSVLAGATAAALEVSSLLAQTRTAEERYRRLAEHAPDVICRYELRPSPGMSYVNPSIEAVTGYTPAEFYANRDLAVQIVHEDDRSLLHAVFRGEAPDGAAVVLRWVRKNGDVVWVELRGVTVRDATGRIVDVEAIARDVTERRQMESALRRTNEDLRRFAWAASHDLQEPLRTIALYTSLVERTYQGRLDKQAGECLSYAAEGAKRIYAMVKELRAFVEAGDVTPAADVAADSGAVLRSVIADLRPAIEASQAELVVGELPRVRMDERHLGEVFRRLLDNALKFRRLDCRSRIELSAEKNGDSLVLSVLDNGIGIAPTYHSRIFDVFQRLNRREEYGGNGMGLAICRRIAEAHGGTLWVESQEGEGARFCLRIPAPRTTTRA